MSKNTWENHIPGREWILEESDDNFLNRWIEEAHDEWDMNETNLIFGENDEDEEHPIALVWSCSCFFILSNSDSFAFAIVNSLQHCDLNMFFSVVMIYLNIHIFIKNCVILPFAWFSLFSHMKSHIDNATLWSATFTNQIVKHFQK